MSSNNSSQKVVAASREQYKQTQKAQKVKKEKNKATEKTMSDKRKKLRIRLIPIWLRIIILVLLLAVSVITGAMFGYSVMGEGKAGDVLGKSTWTHILDLIQKE